MKKTLIALLGLSVSVAFYACNDDDTTNTPTPAAPARLTATLAQPTSVTGTSTTATGSFSGNVDRTTNVMSYTVAFSGVSPSAITIDPVSTTGTAPTSLTLTGAGSTSAISSPYSGTSSVTADQLTGLTNNAYQVNVRSATYPDGALRGAITQQQ
ncbi:CHRD domain-containing protein [Spirosoma montaniterrae]|uniref:CHRD domain-containing protein n=1 Tax=Spirosoma montaniterrae TaxID=1178516 RepID=A0A1P9WTZ8_9BACT|nr:CHRD domain-containing protein [Spirosoma montaniterrae]AQG78803.1 hypothetical protein AWR27_05360 [Spirosoma montaniterrae]